MGDCISDVSCSDLEKEEDTAKQAGLNSLKIALILFTSIKQEVNPGKRNLLGHSAKNNKMVKGLGTTGILSLNKGSWGCARIVPQIRDQFILQIYNDGDAHSGEDPLVYFAE